jgi:hypothetical protein
MFAIALVAGCHEQARNGGTEVSLAAGEITLLEKTEELGTRIYMHDQYAARATHLLFAHGVDLGELGTQGWITEERPDGCVVTFVAREPQPWRSVSVVTFAGAAEPNLILVDKDLTETQAAMFNARQLVLSVIEHPCSDGYNTVVIPQDGGGLPNAKECVGDPGPTWLAYALAATRDPNLFLVGGHYRATVSADGRTLLEKRRFTKDCSVLRSSEAAGGDVELAAYTLEPVPDDRPTEIHVFLNLLCGKPLYIVTADRRFWRIEGGKITLLKQP